MSSKKFCKNCGHTEQNCMCGESEFVDEAIAIALGIELFGFLSKSSNNDSGIISDDNDLPPGTSSDDIDFRGGGDGGDF